MLLDLKNNIHTESNMSQIFIDYCQAQNQLIVAK